MSIAVCDECLAGEHEDCIGDCSIPPCDCPDCWPPELMPQFDPEEDE